MSIERFGITKRSAARLGLTLIIISTFVPRGIAASQESLDNLPSQRRLASNVAASFYDVCARQHMACGLEMNACSGFGTMPNLFPVDMTLAKALDRIVALHPDMRWEVRAGVVNLEPVQRIGQDILSRKLGKVSLHGVMSDQAFTSVLESAGLTKEAGYTPHQGTRCYAPIDLELRDVTVRQALNAIAKADGQLVWEIAQDNPTKLTVCSNTEVWESSSTTAARFSEHDRSSKCKEPAKNAPPRKKPTHAVKKSSNR